LSQFYSNEGYLSKRTYTYKINSDNTASVERAVYQDGGVTNILAKSLHRRTIELYKKVIFEIRRMIAILFR